MVAFATLLDTIEGTAYKLTLGDRKHYLIGRAHECDIRIGSKALGSENHKALEEVITRISRTHAELWYDNDGIVYLVGRGRNSTHVGPEETPLETKVEVNQKVSVPFGHRITLVEAYPFKLYGPREAKNILTQFQKKASADTEYLDPKDLKADHQSQ